MKRIAIVTFVLLLWTFPVASYAASTGPVHLTISGCSNGQVFSVNQPFRVSPKWANGIPEVIGGGSLAYDWSPLSLVQKQDETGAVFCVPERQDSLGLFVSARIDGPGVWVTPTGLPARIGSAHVVIAGLSDASQPTVNYTDERVCTRTVAPGQPFTLTAEWRNAEGGKVSPPSNVRYEWACNGTPAPAITADSLALEVSSQKPGAYNYMLRAYDTADGYESLLCAVQFPVIVTDDVHRTFSITSQPPAEHGIVFVAPSETAILTASADPPDPTMTYSWQVLNSSGVWEDADDNSSSFVVNASAMPVGTAKEYRCIGKAGDWAGETQIVSVHVVDPDYFFQTSPTDMCAPSGMNLALCMQAAVIHSPAVAAEAEWQYRRNTAADWQPASLAVPGFTEAAPRVLSPTLTLFSWIPAGEDSSQNGEFRCVCGGTASASATLTITPAGALGLYPAAPLKVTNSQELGSILYGIDAPPANAAISAADLAARIRYPVQMTPRVLQHARSMAGIETVGTGCELQLLESNGNVSGGATLVMLGDVLGTGRMGVSQLVRAAKAFMEPEVQPLVGPFFAAGDFNGNGKLDLSDIIGMARLLIEDNAFNPL